MVKFSKKHGVAIFVIILIVVFAIAAAIIVPKFIKSDDEEEFKITPPDAGDYFEENSQIVNVIDVKKSETVPNESMVLEMLAKRGFSQVAVETEYDMDGEYSEAAEISADSDEKHPIYYTYYVNSREELWMIYVINGSVMATPVSYNLQSGKDVQVTFSESEEVTSYDSTTNKFYVTVPDKSELIVKVVEKIDANTLENMTVGEIEYYD